MAAIAAAPPAPPASRSGSRWPCRSAAQPRHAGVEADRHRPAAGVALSGSGGTASASGSTAPTAAAAGRRPGPGAGPAAGGRRATRVSAPSSTAMRPSASASCGRAISTRGDLLGAEVVCGGQPARADGPRAGLSRRAAASPRPPRAASARPRRDAKGLHQRDCRDADSDRLRHPRQPPGLRGRPRRGRRLRLRGALVPGRSGRLRRRSGCLRRAGACSRGDLPRRQPRSRRSRHAAAGAVLARRGAGRDLDAADDHGGDARATSRVWSPPSSTSRSACITPAPATRCGNTSSRLSRPSCASTFSPTGLP